MSGRASLVFTLLVLGAALALLATVSAERSGPLSRGHMIYAFPPDSLGEIVDESDIIFLGTIMDVTDGGMYSFGPVDPTPTLDAISPDPYVLLRSKDTMYEIQMAMVSIEVDEVYFSRNPIDLQPLDVVTMTRAADASNYSTPTAGAASTIYGYGKQTFRMAGPMLGAVGEQRLFLLTAEDAPSLAGLYGPTMASYSVLDVGGSEVTISTNPPIPIEVANSAAPSAFLQELKDLIAQQ